VGAAGPVGLGPAQHLSRTARQIAAMNSEASATDTSRNTAGWPPGTRLTSRSSCHLAWYSWWSRSFGSLAMTLMTRDLITARSAGLALEAIR